MGRKVFISFLGTNNYLETYYSLNGVKSNKSVRFIQDALIDFLCKDWNEKDKILIFYTELSKTKNWENNGHERVNSEIEKRGLRSTLIAKELKVQIDEDTIIPEGFSEEEIWKIFEKVYSKLENGDELYFDVTHAFRSIPLFSIVLFNFAKTMINTRIISIHYGAFEKLGDAYKVREMPIEDRIAPILDLTSVIRLQELTQTANNFIEFGKVGKNSNLIQFPNQNKVLIKKQGQINQAINLLEKNMNLFDDYLLTCRMSDIKSGKFIKDIRLGLSLVIKSASPTNPEKTILKKIEEDLSDFSSEETDLNIEAAINWALKYNLIQQAYTLGQEYIISRVCILLSKYNIYEKYFDINQKLIKANKEDIKKKIRENKIQFRTYVSAVLSISDEDIPDGLKGALLEHKENTLDILKLGWIHPIRESFKIIAKNRNILNHAKGTEDAKNIKNAFSKPYQKCLVIINEQSC